MNTGTLIALGGLALAGLVARWQWLDRRQRSRSVLKITHVDNPSGASSGGDDDSFRLPVHVANAGPPTAGVYVVMLGGDVVLDSTSGGLAIDADAPATWELQVRNDLMRWRPQSRGWDYSGEGELAVELRAGAADGKTLDRFGMPSGMAM